MINIEVKDCIEYLNNNYFTDIRFIEENDEGLLFSAIDEDDLEKEILFEIVEGNAVLVSVRHSKDEPFVILEHLVE
jgi:hypothetical protein